MKKQLTLGELIKKLEVQRQDKQIEFDFCGFSPTGISSYRGYYDQLAISYDKIYPRTILVSDVLLFCKESIGKTFQGYKGGDFLMDEDTPMWVANYGETGDTAIIDVVDKTYVVIETRNIED